MTPVSSGFSGWVNNSEQLQVSDNQKNESENITDLLSIAFHSTEAGSQDQVLIEIFEEEVVGGFLDLGKKEGWNEKLDPKIGAAFTRYMLKEYIKNKKNTYSNTAILEKTLESFSNIGDFDLLPITKDPADGYRPTTNRVRYDSGVKGWEKHAITRLVGNVGCSYNPNLPFFEILVNSEVDLEGNKLCKPFFITVYNNESELDVRREDLSEMQNGSGYFARPIFYDSFLKSPEEFLLDTKSQIDSNSERFLKGLIYLTNMKMEAQIVENCWIKQPMRALLASTQP